MADYAIGYKKPPKGRPFAPGTSGNRNGRPKGSANRLGELVQKTLDAPMPYSDNGRQRTASKREVAVRVLARKAVNGDVAAAELLMRKRSHAIKHGQKSATRVVVINWLAEYDGQTRAEDSHTTNGDEG